MRLSRNIVLLLCAGVVIMTSIGMNSFSLFLRPIEAGFGWSRTVVTIPYMFGMLGWGVGGVLFGKLADDLGARPVILGGILLMAAGFFGMGVSQNLWQLSLSYGIMVGMAKGACGLVIISLLVAKHYEAKNRGLAAESAFLHPGALFFDRDIRLACRGSGERCLARCRCVAGRMAGRARP
jgi:MFS family permease